MTRFALAGLLILAACSTPTNSPPPSIIAAPPPPPPGLTRILGGSVATVTGLLGPASLDRSEGTGRQLVFIRPQCVLDIFFYPGPGGAAAAVRTASARRPDGSRMDPGLCLTLVVPPGR